MSSGRAPPSPVTLLLTAEVFVIIFSAPTFFHSGKPLKTIFQFEASLIPEVVNSRKMVSLSPSSNVYAALNPELCILVESNRVTAQNFFTRTELMNSFLPVTFANASKQ